MLAVALSFIQSGFASHSRERKLRTIFTEYKEVKNSNRLTDFFFNPIGQFHKLVHAELLRTLCQLGVSQELRMVAVG